MKGAGLLTRGLDWVFVVNLPKMLLGPVQVRSQMTFLMRLLRWKIFFNSCRVIEPPSPPSSIQKI